MRPENKKLAIALIIVVLLCAAAFTWRTEKDKPTAHGMGVMIDKVEGNKAMGTGFYLFSNGYTENGHGFSAEGKPVVVNFSDSTKFTRVIRVIPESAATRKPDGGIAYDYNTAELQPQIETVNAETFRKNLAQFPASMELKTAENVYGMTEVTATEITYEMDAMVPERYSQLQK